MATLVILAAMPTYAYLNARRAERIAPREGDTVDVEGATIHFVVAGEGPTILLIHGLGGQSRNYSYALTALLAQRYRVVTIDRPGSGYSVLRDEALRGIEGQALIVARLIKALKLNRPLVVGHSLGGAIALALAIDHPDLIRGLALVAPLTQPLERPPSAFAALDIRTRWLRILLAWTLATPMAKINREGIWRLLFGPDTPPDDFSDRGGGVLTLRPSAFTAAASEVALGTERLRHLATLYPRIDMPVGILFGAEDRILSPSEHGLPTTSLIPGAQLTTIPGGHMIPITAPEAVSEWIEVQFARADDAAQSRSR